MRGLDRHATRRRLRPCPTPRPVPRWKSPTFSQASSVRTLSEGGAAAGLEAETSKNITFGLVLQPSLGDAGGLSMAIDYFDIKIDNGVDQPGAPNILPRCYDDPQFRASYTANGLQSGYLPHAEYVRFLDDFARQTEGFLRDAGVIR